MGKAADCSQAVIIEYVRKMDPTHVSSWQDAVPSRDWRETENAWNYHAAAMIAAFNVCATADIPFDYDEVLPYRTHKLQLFQQYLIYKSSHLKALAQLKRLKARFDRHRETLK